MFCSVLQIILECVEVCWNTLQYAVVCCSVCSSSGQ